MKKIRKKVDLFASLLYNSIIAVRNYQPHTGHTMTVAHTILDQIKMADRAAMMAWGAKELVRIENGLRFKSTGMVKWKGYVEITLDEGVDLYTLKFFKMRKGERKIAKSVTDIYCDELVSVIDSVVG